jgi:hypothetical protein
VALTRRRGRSATARRLIRPAPVDVLRRQRESGDKLLPVIFTRPGNGRRAMTVSESKSLKKGSRVYWRGDANDSGRITETSWDAVTIAWDNGQVATVHHGDMREIQRMPTKRATV